MVKLPNLKVLVLDIEWRPVKALVWQAWDQTIHPENIIEDGGLLCVGAKWLGDKTCYLFSEWEHGHIGMLEGIHEMMSEADAIVTYNGDKYDIRKLEGEFVLHELPPTPPCPSIDCLKAVKRFGFFMNKLAFIGPYLKIGGKLKHEGMYLWRKVMDGDEQAQRRMARYCLQDVRLTEKLYLKIRPYIRNHPYLGKAGADECPACGGKHSHRRGTYRTRCFQKQRLRCTSCGHWRTGKQTRI